MESARWDGAPPPSRGGGTFYKVRVLEVGRPIDLTFLSERFLGVWVHWVYDESKKKDRSRHCTQFMGECPFCNQWPRRWLGYAAIFNNQNNLREVLCLGVEGARACLEVAAPFGCLWMVRANLAVRAVGASHRLFASKASDPPRQKLTAHDVRETVRRLLGAVRLDESEYEPQDVSALMQAEANGGDS